MINILALPLGYIMWLCYKITNSYVFAIIGFTLLTKLILFPLSLWVQKNSIKMVKILPQVNMIAARNASDSDSAAREQTALYKKENYKPLLGIIPMLIQIPLILGVINVIYNPLSHLLHIDSQVIDALIAKAQDILGAAQLGGDAQINVVELIKDVRFSDMFASVSVGGHDVSSVLTQIQNFDMSFLGLNLAKVPDISDFGPLFMIPVLAALSSMLLSVLQNKVNVLQKEQSFWGKWGMAIFLTLFSLWFAFAVPAGVGVYWIFGNLFSIAVMYVVNAVYNPKKYIDYAALEESKLILAQSKIISKAKKGDKEQKRRAKEDYKRFLNSSDKKQLVFYSEKSGFYKYYKSVIAEIIKNSDIVIHYITSDPNDVVFTLNEPQLQPYYADDNRLIVLFMKMDADMVVMTMPDIENYYFKRSYVRKDIEYVYMFHGVASPNLLLRKGALRHYDTIFLVGPNMREELTKEEEIYNYKKRKLVSAGYPLIDENISIYNSTEKRERTKPQLLIAPSWHEGNIIESCIDEVLNELSEGDYRVILRPHPEFIKRFPHVINALADKYKARINDDFIIQTDFSSNDTVYESDILITDWSTICYEYSFVTKRPTLFINTPMKVMNDDYKELGIVPLDIYVRNEIGRSCDTGNISEIGNIIRDMLDNPVSYSEQIEKAMDYALYNVGQSAKLEAEYIISELERKKEELTL